MLMYKRYPTRKDVAKQVVEPFLVSPFDKNGHVKYISDYMITAIYIGTYHKDFSGSLQRI